MLLIVLEVHFSLLFSNKAYFRVYFVVCKIQLPFLCRSLLLGTSVPNDRYKYDSKQGVCNEAKLCRKFQY